jgi:uncharacterized membrane protein YbhN (UPF0104 family)
VRRKVARALPWIISIGLVAFLLYRYPISQIQAHILAGSFWPMVPLALLASVWSLLCVSYGDALVFRVLGRASFGRVLAGKAATSTLTALNYGASSGGYGLWIARATGANLKQSVGLVVYIMMCDLAAVCLIALFGLTIGGDAIPAKNRWIVRIVALGVVFGVSVLALAGPRVLKGWLRDPEFAEPWARVPAKIYFANLVIRVANLSVATILTFLAARFFGLELPFLPVIIYMPIIFLIGALPVNIAGFGAVQFAWIAFFHVEGKTDETQIIAFQFLYQLLVMAGLILRGVPFLKRVAREIEAGTAKKMIDPAHAESGGSPLGRT